MYKNVRILAITFSFILGVLSLGFPEESVTITTYYPSPYGSYNELTTYSNTYLATSSGNVGIGLSNPGTKLAVKGLTGSASGSLLRYSDTTAGRIYYESSSIKYKEDVKLLKDNFNKILKVKPHSFIDKATGNKEIGYIAEEIDKLGLNNLVIYRDNAPESIKYERLVLYLIEVVKNQQKQINYIEKKLKKR